MKSDTSRCLGGCDRDFVGCAYLLSNGDRINSVPIRGSLNEEHDDPPIIEGGYRGDRTERVPMRTSTGRAVMVHRNFYNSYNQAPELWQSVLDDYENSTD